MVKIIDFLRDCYNTEMYSEGETFPEIAVKYISLVFDFFVVLPFYFLFLLLSYLTIKGAVNLFYSNNELLSNQWLWMLTGVLFGLFLSVIFQAIPKKGESPKNVLTLLFHHLIFLSVFFMAFLLWIVIFAYLGTVF